jgi:hypothetical protein
VMKAARLEPELQGVERVSLETLVLGLEEHELAPE